MISRLFRIVFKLGVVGSVTAVAVKALGRRRSASPASDWSTSAEPWPPVDLAGSATTEATTGATTGAAPADEAEVLLEAEDALEADAEMAAEVAEVAPDSAAADAPGSWSDPADDGSCPTSHPVKAKLTSKVFHLPGMANYERTKADRCYLDAGAAEADGLRQAKR